MRNTISRSPRSMISKRSPVTLTKCGMSIAASGSVQRTSSRSPGVKDFKALRTLSAGRGHFSPDRSNWVMVMARHVRIVRGPSIAASLVLLRELLVLRQSAGEPGGAVVRSRDATLTVAFEKRDMFDQGLAGAACRASKRHYDE